MNALLDEELCYIILLYYSRRIADYIVNGWCHYILVIRIRNTSSIDMYAVAVLRTTSSSSSLESEYYVLLLVQH